MSFIENLIIDIKSKIHPILILDVTIQIDKKYKTKLWVPVLFFIATFIFAFLSGFFSSNFNIIQQILSPVVFASIFGATILSIGFFKSQGKLEMLTISNKRIEFINNLHKVKFGQNDILENITLETVKYFSINSLQKLFNLIIKIKLEQNYELEYQSLIIQMNSEVFSNPVKNNLNKIKINGNLFLSQLQWLLNASKEEIQKKQIVLSKIFISQTDTIPGIFCKIKDKSSADEIYKIKNRDKSKPLCIYSPNPEKYLAENSIISLIKKDLSHIPLTVVSKPSLNVPYFLIKKGFVGVRLMRSSSEFFNFLKQENFTIVGTSANFSNENSPISINNLDINFAENLPILQFNDSETKQESSIIKIDENKIIILREGSFFEELESWIKKLNSSFITTFEDGVEKKSYIINL